MSRFLDNIKAEVMSYPYRRRDLIKPLQADLKITDEMDTVEFGTAHEIRIGVKYQMKLFVPINDPLPPYREKFIDMLRDEVYGDIVALLHEAMMRAAVYHDQTLNDLLDRVMENIYK